MRKIGADDDQRFVAAPQPLDDFRYLVDRRLAHREWNQAELAQHNLQERQLDFQ
jgi:hypothetical protein